ncbi:MAG: carboxylating nicotinate-nucleotide diphosphorylase [Bacteroidia bacterium]|nr:carboxylating nicotinate-nucleotide diphosphorylase [Bacteroidia bacterium]
MTHTEFLHHPETDKIIRYALEEDIRSGDHTTLATIPASKQAIANAILKEEAVIAGIDFAEKVFRTVEPDILFEPFAKDGDQQTKGAILFQVKGTARTLLSCERLMLNVLQRMSGIATKTRQLVEQLQGTKCKILDTRKTTPLIRHLEKWAVQIGGGINHRFGLYDMILIKDNHIDVAGGIIPAIQAAHQYLQQNSLDLPIVVETRTLAEVKEVLSIGGITRILLDNMPLEMQAEAVKLINGSFPTEASGNITEDNIRAKAETGVDFVSIGALTHSVKSIDISFKIQL